MYEVSSGKRSRELDAVYLHEMDAADVHLGKLTLRCKQGHMTVVTLPIPAFEMLFDFGCSALLDGYPREAVTSFACSLERFEEFTCRFLLARRNVSFAGIDGWWKEVAKKSERQKGSFVALWISEFFREPPLLPRKLDELRNACVHAAKKKCRRRPAAAAPPSRPVQVGRRQSALESAPSRARALGQRTW